ncbi:MAG TPA: ATP-binding protein [Geodermatophilus sp.]|nr:ATP-binding protein [Geodermatophilus sp.]
MSAESDPAPTGADRGPPRKVRRSSGLPRELTIFLAVALLVLVAVATGTVLISERIARENALTEAARTAQRLTDLLVEPVLRDALAGIPGRWEELDRDVTNRLSDGSITSLVVWTARGEVLYATKDELVGQQFPPTRQLLAATSGEVVAEVDEMPETSYQGEADTPMLEVYVPLTIRGETLAVETYFSYDSIYRQAALLRGQIIPMAVGALVLLQLVQIPIATSLARRVRRQEAERTELVERTLVASERERRAIAADIHDGPVQDLAGVSYALSALRASVPPERQATVDRLVGAIRNAVQSLRRLMVDIYPPELSGAGLATAMQDLTEPLRTQGVEVSVDTGPLPEMSPNAAAVLYRTAKEALVNVANHAKATRVWVTLEETRHQGTPAVRLEVADDGVGFPETGTDRRSEGHFGLSLVHDRIQDQGGSLHLGPRAGGGAVLTAVVPVGHRE